MRYEEPPLLGHDVAETALAAALRGEGGEPDAGSVLVGLAMFDEDRAFVERWCVRIASEAPDRRLRGLAVLCIGTHLARRFGEVGGDAVAVVRELAADPEMRKADGRVSDAAEDLDRFLRRKA